VLDLGAQPSSSTEQSPIAVGLAEGTVDRAGFGDAHLGAVDQGRDVGRIGVPIADEPARAGRFVDGRPEDPTADGRITTITYTLNADPVTSGALCEANQPRVGDIPLAVQEE